MLKICRKQSPGALYVLAANHEYCDPFIALAFLRESDYDHDAAVHQSWKLGTHNKLGGAQQKNLTAHLLGVNSLLAFEHKYFL